MKNLLFCSLFLFTLLNPSLNAQCTTSQGIFVQNPATQASIIAAADNTIKEVIDEQTGNSYFVRQVKNPWDGKLVSLIVLFDTASASFIDTELYAINKEEEVELVYQKICPSRQDTCIQKHPNLLKIKEEVRPKPRRSSRVKLANNF